MCDTYVISDLHLTHDNIREYCDRPFDSVAEMDEVLMRNWNREVGENDTVIFVGDFIPWCNDTTELSSVLDYLNGNIEFIIGNHDIPEALPIHWYDYAIQEFNGIEFYITHRQNTIPSDWLASDNWAIHGHTHNNHLDEYPFINPDTQTINVSVELVGYKPVSVDELCSYIHSGDRIEKRKVF